MALEYSFFQWNTCIYLTCVFKTKEFCPRKVFIIGDPDFITVFSLSFELGRYIIIITLLVVIFCFYASSELPSHPTFKKHYNRGISLCKIAKSLCNGICILHMQKYISFLLEQKGVEQKCRQSWSLEYEKKGKFANFDIFAHKLHNVVKIFMMEHSYYVF